MPQIGKFSSNKLVTPPKRPILRNVQTNRLVSTNYTGTTPPQQGYKLAISSNGDVLLAMSRFTDDNKGAVWLYIRSGADTWIEKEKYVPGGGSSNSGFFGLDITADASVWAVGDISYPNNTGAGTVYVYTKIGDTYTYSSQQLTFTGNVGNARFGSTLKISDNGNTLVISGHADNSDKGALWTFKRSNGIWSQSGSKLVAADSHSTGQWGNTFSLSADGNTLIVNGSQNGTTRKDWLYYWDGSQWNLQAGTPFTYSGVIGNISALARYSSISSSGKVVAISVPNEDTGIGAIYIFNSSGNTWTQTARIQPTDWNYSYGFPITYRAAFSTRNGERALNDTGNIIVFAGNDAPSNNAARSSAYTSIWTWNNYSGTWLQQSKTTITLGNIGSPISLTFCISSDGSTLAIGTPNDASDTGATYIVR